MKHESLLPTVEKYISIAKSAVEINRTDGLVELTIGKDFKEYEGVPPETKKRFNIALRPNWQTISELLEVSSAINREATALGAEMALAGKDYPYHISILELRQEVGNIDEETERKLSEEVANNKIIQSLNTQPIFLDYLFIDKGGNIILASKTIPQTVLDARIEIGRIGDKYGLKTLPLDNILHMSIARPKKLPPMKKRATYYKMSEARLHLNKSNIKINGSVTGQTAWNLLKEKNTSL